MHFKQAYLRKQMKTRACASSYIIVYYAIRAVDVVVRRFLITTANILVMIKYVSTSVRMGNGGICTCTQYYYGVNNIHMYIIENREHDIMYIRYSKCQQLLCTLDERRVRRTRFDLEKPAWARTRLVFRAFNATHLHYSKKWLRAKQHDDLLLPSPTTAQTILSIHIFVIICCAFSMYKYMSE